MIRSCFTLALSAVLSLLVGNRLVAAPELKAGDKAPLFKAKNQAGEVFDLAGRGGKGWTVLYFYPKAETPGCTKQACAFRDRVEAIRGAGAEVYGISADTVAEQHVFHDKHGLRFDLIADPDGAIISAYGAAVMNGKQAKRWTFLLDDKLVIRWVEHDVDPLLDAQRIEAKIKALKAGKM